MKNILMLFLCLILTLGLFPISSMAELDWPGDISIEADGGIVMDADSGTVLYGKNSNVAYFPASITKLMTALLVIETCSLDEEVIFSEEAITNVEYNSKSLGLVAGDTLSVKDCLYGLLLQSANEVANGLAEHVSGSNEEFANLMNEKAVQLGCTDTNFVNPSGLNDPEHVTSAYDMALITKAALQNETLVEIDSTLSYHTPPTRDFKNGLDIYPGHKMLKKSQPEYYPGIIGGKTGYTSLAGNTLVTYAERDGMRLVAVVLNGHQTHYTDTKTLLDFGFKNFQDLKAADYDTAYTSMETDMTIAGLTNDSKPALIMDSGSVITLPITADFADLTSTISYELTEQDPTDSVARVEYLYGERKVGSAYLKTNNTALEPESTAPVVTAPNITIEEDATPSSVEISSKTTPIQKKPFAVPSILWIILIVILVLSLLVGGAIAIKVNINKKEEIMRIQRRERRMQRIREAGYSTEEFDKLLDQKRSTYTIKRNQRSRGRRRH